MINIKDKKAKQEQQKKIDKMMRLIEFLFARQLLKIFKRQHRRAAQLFLQGVRQLDIAVDESRFKLEQLYMIKFRKIANIFRKEIFENKAIREFIQPNMIDEFYRSMEGWARLRTGRRVRLISDSKKRQLKKILEDGVSKGLSQQEIAKSIREDVELKAYKAKRIARTETHTATVVSMYTAINSTGLRFEREWVTAGDERVRKPSKKGTGFDHFGADGETVPMDGLYKETGESLKYPGDPDGSPGNIIQCRCIEIFHTIRNY